MTGTDKTTADASPALAGGCGSRLTGSPEDVSAITERSTSGSPTGVTTEAPALPIAAKVGAHSCQHCEFSCRTKMGLSQHLRVKHPLEHQKRLKTDDNLKRVGYSLAELHLLAEAEVGLPQPTRFVNIALADLGIVDRTSEQIRQMRKRSD